MVNSIVTLTNTNKKQKAELRALRDRNVNLKKKVEMTDAGGG